MGKRHLSMLKESTEGLLKITERLLLSLDQTIEVMDSNTNVGDLTIVSTQRREGIYKRVLNKVFSIMAVLLLFVSICLFVLLLVDHKLFFGFIESINLTIWKFMGCSFVILLGMFISDNR